MIEHCTTAQMIRLLVLFSILIISCKKSETQEIIDFDGGSKKVIYYSNGAIKSEVMLEDGEPHGTEIVLFKNGKLKAENDWYRGKPLMHQFEYYDIQDTIILETEGEPILGVASMIKSYNYINGLGGISYTINYSEEGLVVEQKGNSVVTYAVNKPKFFLNDTLSLELQYPLIDAMVKASIHSVGDNDEYLFLDSLEVSYEFMISEYEMVVDSKITLAIITEIETGGYSKIDTAFISTIVPEILSGS